MLCHNSAFVRGTRSHHLEQSASTSQGCRVFSFMFVGAMLAVTSCAKEDDGKGATGIRGARLVLFLRVMVVSRGNLGNRASAAISGSNSR